MNNQQAFDAALFGVRGQEYVPSSQDRDCLYRGPDGLKCGIGHSLPDALYEPAFDDVKHMYAAYDIEDTSITVIIEANPEVRAFYAECNFDMLGELQKAHDCLSGVGTPVSFETSMKRIAQTYGLHYTPVPA